MTQFLYELICKQECFAIHIKDQRRKFVNKISNNLNEMTRLQVISVYHPQFNGL